MCTENYAGMTDAAVYEPLAGATKRQFLWLCALFLSFCYELPLVELTSMDRVNPRLFDVVFLAGLFFIYPTIDRTIPTPKLFKIWVGIVAIFGFCAAAWTLWVPFEHIKFSWFFLFRYVQGLVTVYMVIKIPLSSRQKKILHYLVVVGGVVVALYAVPEYVRGGTVKMAMKKTEKEVIVAEGVLLSCLGPNNFHLAQFSAMASVMTLAFFHAAKTSVTKFLCFALGAFVSWPAFFCGSRGGMVAVGLSWGFLFLFSKFSFKANVIILMVLAFFIIAVLSPQLLSVSYLREKSLTFDRFFGKREAGTGEIFHGFDFNMEMVRGYRWQGWRIPFIGAGFGFAPVTYPDGTMVYRHSFGIHNSYLFALEQGGLGVFVLFIVFLVVCSKSLKRMRKWPSNKSDYAFALGMHSYFFAILVVMLPGQIFWRGFGSVNFNTYLIMLFILAIIPSHSSEQEHELEQYDSGEYYDESQEQNVEGQEIV